MYTEEEIKEAIKDAKALIIKSDYSINQEQYKESLLSLIIITSNLVGK